MEKKTFTTDDKCQLEERESELIKKGYVLSNKGELRPGKYKKRQEGHPLTPKPVLIIEWIEIQD
jgi:hypothetical protein